VRDSGGMEHSAESDAALLVRVGDRDESALRELFDRHSAWLTLRLGSRCSSEELVSTALQDTFVAVWKKPSAYRGNGDVGAWLWGIAIRRLISQLRKKAAPTPLAAETIAAVAPVVASAEDQLLLAVENGSVGEALRTLSPQMRQALQVTVIDGLTAKEAAHLLGVPEGTVKSRVRLAKEQLRRQLVNVEGW
jgi:RNA polymerase sigma-70 factor, ECF subfamily